MHTIGQLVKSRLHWPLMARPAGEEALSDDEVVVDEVDDGIFSFVVVVVVVLLLLLLLLLLLAAPITRRRRRPLTLAIFSHFPSLHGAD